MAPKAAIFVQDAMNAVIGVGEPWYTSGVEEQADDQHSETEVEQDIRLPGRALRDEYTGQGDRVGVTVDQRNAVKEERRGKGTQQEVLQRSLLAEQPAAAGESGEQV